LLDSLIAQICLNIEQFQNARDFLFQFSGPVQAISNNVQTDTHSCSFWPSNIWIRGPKALMQWNPNTVIMVTHSSFIEKKTEIAVFEVTDVIYLTYKWKSPGFISDNVVETVVGCCWDRMDEREAVPVLSG
jgi:hypothetical protein